MNKYIIKESQFPNLLNIVMEQIDDDRYDEVDIYDAFFQIFRSWIANNAQEKDKQSPMSFLMKKYGYRFVKEYLGDEFSEKIGMGQNHTLSRYDIQKVMREIVKQGKYKMSSNRADVKFTEKFGKYMDFIIDAVGIPSWIDLEIEEQKPYDITLKFNTNIDGMLKDESANRYSPSSLKNKFTKYIENYLGVEEGNPLHGDISVDYTSTDNSKEWTKKVFTPIKNTIKTFKDKSVRAIKLKIHNSYAEMTVYFFDGLPWTERKPLQEKIKEYINSLGLRNLRVEFGW